jgi:homoserine O-acetyltransferase/O-succinyltransferase
MCEEVTGKRGGVSLRVTIRLFMVAVVTVVSVGALVMAKIPPSKNEAGAPEESGPRAGGALKLASTTSAKGVDTPATTEGDYTVKDFKFKDGERIPELTLHYTTLGSPQRDAQGHVTNAVMILHGTGGTGHQFLAPQFAGELFGAGQLLDAAKYYIILPDGIGHGKSSKPSDGLHARFPHYDYDDMVAAQHALLTQKLGVRHLRLLMGTSMGCMHSFVWGETHPQFMDALMPLACLPVQIGGRNRLWRKMVMDAIRSDPEWKSGEYEAEPQQALRTALDLLTIAGSAPLPMQKSYPTRDAADKFLDEDFARRRAGLDANDLLYAVNASRNYDPSPKLETIQAPVMWINSADDFINPPELGIAEREVTRLKNARFVLIPASEQTHGHGTHTWAMLWQQYLQELLEKTEKKTE